MHPAEKYAQDVIDGNITACHWVKRACKRYFDDKKHAKKRGLYFDLDAAQLAIDVITITSLPDGSPFRLENWALFAVWNLYGWYRASHKRWKIRKDGKTEDTSGTRRYRSAYFEMGRKNIKTSFGSRNCLKLAFADGKTQSNVYTAANKRDQARICFDDARITVETSPFFREDGGIEILRNNLNQQHTYSKIEPLSADSRSMDGLRAHGIILDEIHEWRDGAIYDKLQRSTSTDESPMVIMITTAGTYEDSKFCWQLHEYSCKVLDGIIQDDTWFSLIYTIDDKDDWTDQDVWIKANPYLGLSKKWDYMQTAAEHAKNDPAELNKFLRYDLNVWVRSDMKWMPMDEWRINAGPLPADAFEKHLLGRLCYVGLDLSSSIDLTALVLEFPPIPADPYTYILPYFFCPEDNILKRSRNDRVPYDLWVDQGYLIATPGNVIDESFILSKIGDLQKVYNIKRLYFDAWGSKSIVVKLQDEYGFTVDQNEAEVGRLPLLVEFRQGNVSMDAPMKDLIRFVLRHDYRHGDHPILNWNIDNLVAVSGATGLLKPDKSRSRERIDGAVALIMAHAGSMIHIPEEQSIYETRGIISI